MALSSCPRLVQIGRVKANWLAFRARQQKLFRGIYGLPWGFSGNQSVAEQNQGFTNRKLILFKERLSNRDGFFGLKL